MSGRPGASAGESVQLWKLSGLERISLVSKAQAELTEQVSPAIMENNCRLAGTAASCVGKPNASTESPTIGIVWVIGVKVLPNPPRRF